MVSNKITKRSNREERVTQSLDLCFPKPQSWGNKNTASLFSSTPNVDVCYVAPATHSG